MGDDRERVIDWSVAQSAFLVSSGELRRYDKPSYFSRALF